MGAADTLTAPAKTASSATAKGMLILVNSCIRMEEAKRASRIEVLKPLQPTKVEEEEEWPLPPWPAVEPVAVRSNCSNQAKQEELEVKTPRIVSD